MISPWDDHAYDSNFEIAALETKKQALLCRLIPNFAFVILLQLVHACTHFARPISPSVDVQRRPADRLGGDQRRAAAHYLHSSVRAAAAVGASVGAPIHRHHRQGVLPGD